jgi:hypothetical protein
VSHKFKQLENEGWKMMTKLALCRSIQGSIC